jgi:hypothetical protein
MTKVSIKSEKSCFPLILFISSICLLSWLRKCDKEDFISEILEINKSSPIGGPPLDEPNVNIGQAISKWNG